MFQLPPEGPLCSRLPRQPREWRTEKATERAESIPTGSFKHGRTGPCDRRAVQLDGEKGQNKSGVPDRSNGSTLEDTKKSVGKRPNLSDGIYLHGYVEDTPVVFTADTGATKTVISKAVYEKISQEVKPALVETMVLKGAGGAPIAGGGKGNFRLKLGPLKVQHEAVVADIRDEALIGYDLLMSSGKSPADILMSRNVIVKDGVEIPCMSTWSGPRVKKVKVEEDFVVSGNAEAVVDVFVERLEEDGGMSDADYEINPMEAFAGKCKLLIGDTPVETNKHVERLEEDDKSLEEVEEDDKSLEEVEEGDKCLAEDEGEREADFVIKPAEAFEDKFNLLIEDTLVETGKCVERSGEDEYKGKAGYESNPAEAFGEKYTCNLLMGATPVDTSKSLTCDGRSMSPFPSDATVRQETVVGTAEQIEQDIHVAAFQDQEHTKQGHNFSWVKRVQTGPKAKQARLEQMDTREKPTDVPPHLKILYENHVENLLTQELPKGEAREPLPSEVGLVSPTSTRGRANGINRNRQPPSGQEVDQKSTGEDRRKP